MDISSSAVYNAMIQRIYTCKGHGWKTLSYNCAILILRQHRFKNGHHSVMEIPACTQKYFYISLPVNTVHQAVHKWQLMLYHAKKPYLNTKRNAAVFSGTKANLKWTEAGCKTVLRLQELKGEILFGHHGHHVLVIGSHLRSLYLW